MATVKISMLAEYIPVQLLAKDQSQREVKRTSAKA